MLETSTQGIVSVTGTTFVVVPKKTISKIASMRFHNATASAGSISRIWKGSIMKYKTLD